MLLEEEEQNPTIINFLGPVGLIRRMMIAAIICMITFITIGVGQDVISDNMKKSLFEMQGWECLSTMLFLLSVSGLGASFNALFTANRYIQEGTFDPVFEASYWTRFVLGLMAGLIISQLIPIKTPVSASNKSTASPTMTKSVASTLRPGTVPPAPMMTASATNVPAAATPVSDNGSTVSKNANDTFSDVSKPVLALLGGFSASLVYRLLNHLLASVEALVQGDSRELRQANEQLAKARASEQESNYRLQLLSRMSTMQQKLRTNPNPHEILKELADIQQHIAIHGSIGDSRSDELSPISPTETEEQVSSTDGKSTSAHNNSHSKEDSSEASSESIGSTAQKPSNGVASDEPTHAVVETRK